MWHIMSRALEWFIGELKDPGLEACRTCPAKAAIFAAIEQARAAHLTAVAPQAGLC